MKEIIIFLAKEMPQDIIIDKMEEAIRDFKRDPSHEHKMALLMYSHMISLRFGSEGESSIQTITKFNQANTLLKAFDSKQ